MYFINEKGHAIFSQHHTEKDVDTSKVKVFKDVDDVLMGVEGATLEKIHIVPTLNVERSGKLEFWSFNSPKIIEELVFIESHETIIDWIENQDMTVTVS